MTGKKTGLKVAKKNNRAGFLFRERFKFCVNRKN